MKDSNIYWLVNRMIGSLDKQKTTSSTKALLANLRNSINKDLGDNIESLSYVFSFIPENRLGVGKKLNDFEESVLVSLQMYALYQQGKDENMALLAEERTYKNKSFGQSLKSLRGKESDSINLRFNAMVTSANISELKHHLRQMIKLLKSKSNDKVDFGQLAEDIYWFSKGYKEAVRVNWARDYYRQTKEE